MARAFFARAPGHSTGLPLPDNPLRLWSLGDSILASILNRQALNAWVDVSTPGATQMSVVQVKNNLLQAQMD